MEIIYELGTSFLLNYMDGKPLNQTVLGLGVAVLLFALLKGAKSYFKHVKEKKQLKKQAKLEKQINEKTIYDLQEPDEPVKGDVCVFYGRLWEYNGSKWMKSKDRFFPEIGDVVENSDIKWVWNGQSWEKSKFMTYKSKDRFDILKPLVPVEGDAFVKDREKFVFDGNVWVSLSKKYCPKEGDSLKSGSLTYTWNGENWDSAKIEEKKQHSLYVPIAAKVVGKLEPLSSESNVLGLSKDIFARIDKAKNRDSKSYFELLNLCFETIQNQAELIGEPLSQKSKTTLTRQLDNLSTIVKEFRDRSKGSLYNEATSLLMETLKASQQLEKDSLADYIHGTKKKNREFPELKKKSPQKRTINKKINRILKETADFGEFILEPEDSITESKIAYKIKYYLKELDIIEVKDIVFKHKTKGDGYHIAICYKVKESGYESAFTFNLDHDFLKKRLTVKGLSENVEALLSLFNDFEIEVKDSIRELDKKNSLLESEIKEKEYFSTKETKRIFPKEKDNRATFIVTEKDEIEEKEDIWKNFIMSSVSNAILTRE